jgi:EmrB/QacA subfamily drug resistance transporter
MARSQGWVMTDTDVLEAPPPAFTHQQIVRVIGGILLCIFLAAIDQTVVVPAVPAIAQELQGFGHLSWIVSAYLLTSTAATPIYGKLSDIYGRRALLLPALALFALASVMCALAQTLAQLILFRAVQGIGGAGLMAMAQAAIADVVSPRERGRYQGYMASVWGIASIAGPVLGGYVTDHLSWRWIFWINLPIAIVAMILCNRALKLLKVRHARTRIDYVGAALLTGGVAAWLVALSSGGTDIAWTSPQAIGLALGGLVLIGLLAMHERRVRDPLLPPRLFANGVIVRGVMIGFFAALAMFSGTFMLPLFFQLVRGADASGSGLLVVPFLGSTVVGAYLAGRFARRSGRVKPIVLTGLAACVLGFLLLGTTGAGTAAVLLVVYQLVLGAGIGLIMPSTLVMVQNAAERRDVGVATGVLLFLRSMGGAFGSTLAGALLANRFASDAARMGLKLSIDIGEVRGHGSVLDGLAPEIRQAVQASLAGAFHLAFFASGLLLAIAFLVALGTRDLPLRTSSGGEPAPLSH